jgi:hypothetical protein
MEKWLDNIYARLKKYNENSDKVYYTGAIDALELGGYVCYCDEYGKHHLLKYR